MIVFAHLLGRDPTVCNRLQHSKLLLLVGQCEAGCTTLTKETTTWWHWCFNGKHASPVGESALTPNYRAQFLHIDLLWDGEAQNWEMWAKYNNKYTKSLDESKISCRTHALSKSYGKRDSTKYNPHSLSFKMGHEIGYFGRDGQKEAVFLVIAYTGSALQNIRKMTCFLSPQHSS